MWGGGQSLSRGCLSGGPGPALSWGSLSVVVQAPPRARAACLGARPRPRRHEGCAVVSVAAGVLGSQG